MLVIKESKQDKDVIELVDMETNINVRINDKVVANFYPEGYIFIAGKRYDYNWKTGKVE